MNKTAKITLICVLILLLIGAAAYGVIHGHSLSAAATDHQSESVDNLLEYSRRLTESLEAGVSSGEVTVTLADGASRASAAAVSVAGDTVTIRTPGTYRLSGSLSDGQVAVDADGDVVLILDGVSITCAEDAAISILSADFVQVYLAEGSENFLQSGAETEITADAADPEATGGALYSKADLTLDGEGSLTVRGYLNNGIASADNLLLLGGTLDVTAVNNGIKGKDSLTVTGGTITVLSGGDGLKSDNDTDAGCGAVDIRGGSLSITSCGDGIQAQTDLTVSDGVINIIAGGGAGDSVSVDLLLEGAMENWGEMFSGTEGMEPPEDMERPEDMEAPAEGSFGGGKPGGFGRFGETDGTESTESGFGFGGGMFGDFGDMFDLESSSSSSDDTSTKGLKSHGDLTITGGTITVSSLDDSIHADGSVTIAAGVLTLAAGDDGIHADGTVSISGGSIDIIQSHEGIEGHKILVSGGDVSLKAADDGFNANGGSTTGFFGGTATAASDDLPLLRITGGTVYVSADGDGLDSNGDLIIEGGTVIVDGPTNSANGALDSGTESGGSLLVSGGTVIAVGASGMAETFDSASAQCSFAVTLSGTQAAGTEITVARSSGEVLFTHTSAKSFSSVVFSSPDLTLGETYLLTVGDSTTEVTLTDVSTGSSGGMGGWGNMGGGFGGGPRG